MIFIIAGLSLSDYIRSEHDLPVYQPADLNTELVDLSLQTQEQGHKVLDFDLINQSGEKISEADYEEMIYVVDFFFTRCPTICPVMSDNMERLQAEFADLDDFKLLSISVTPEYDSIPVLARYSNKHGALEGKWNITTGDKEHIYNLARKSYFATTDQGDGALQDFIHTSNFILVDKQKQIRGIYEGTKDEEIQRLIQDVYILIN